MAYIFVDDGFPEASEYSNNYVWYDPADRSSVKQAEERAAALKAARDLYGRWFGLRRLLELQ